MSTSILSRAFPFLVPCATLPTLDGWFTSCSLHILRNFRKQVTSFKHARPLDWMTGLLVSLKALLFIVPTTWSQGALPFGLSFPPCLSHNEFDYCLVGKKSVIKPKKPISNLHKDMSEDGVSEAHFWRFYLVYNGTLPVVEDEWFTSVHGLVIHSTFYNTELDELYY